MQKLLKSSQTVEILYSTLTKYSKHFILMAQIPKLNRSVLWAKSFIIVNKSLPSSGEMLDARHRRCKTFKFHLAF